MATIKVTELKGAIVPQNLRESERTQLSVQQKCSISSQEVEAMNGERFIATYMASESFTLFSGAKETRAKCLVYKVSKTEATEDTEATEVATQVATWFAKSVPSSIFEVEIRSSEMKGTLYFYFSSKTAFKK